MNDYKNIFQKRADDYHYAMQKYPNVRVNEFKSLISTIDFSDSKKILDIPSGGCYLKKYLPLNIELYSADFSSGFTNEIIKLVDPEQLIYSDNSFDLVLSLSGMHHLKDTDKFILECLRILKEKGKFIFSDVKKESKVDFFLNKFVNQYSSIGHNGVFFSEHSFNENILLKEKIVRTQYNEYPFLFSNKNEMIDFFRFLFGLDKADDGIIYQGICDILGMKKNKNCIEVKWGLIQFEFVK